MSHRADPATLLCFEHSVVGCQVCVLDDHFEWLRERMEAWRAAKAEAKALTVDERFDLGGEG
jgi:hypothetical protein